MSRVGLTPFATAPSIPYTAASQLIYPAAAQLIHPSMNAAANMKPVAAVKPTTTNLLALKESLRMKIEAAAQLTQLSTELVDSKQGGQVSPVLPPPSTSENMALILSAAAQGDSKSVEMKSNIENAAHIKAMDVDNNDDYDINGEVKFNGVVVDIRDISNHITSQDNFKGGLKIESVENLSMSQETLSVINPQNKLIVNDDDEGVIPTEQQHNNTLINGQIEKSITEQENSTSLISTSLMNSADNAINKDNHTLNKDDKTCINSCTHTIITSTGGNNPQGNDHQSGRTITSKGITGTSNNSGQTSKQIHNDQLVNCTNKHIDSTVKKITNKNTVGIGIDNSQVEINQQTGSVKGGDNNIKTENGDCPPTTNATTSLGYNHEEREGKPNIGTDGSLNTVVNKYKTDQHKHNKHLCDADDDYNNKEVGIIGIDNKEVCPYIETESSSINKGELSQVRKSANEVGLGRGEVDKMGGDNNELHCSLSQVDDYDGQVEGTPGNQPIVESVKVNIRGTDGEVVGSESLGGERERSNKIETQQYNNTTCAHIDSSVVPIDLGNSNNALLKGDLTDGTDDRSTVAASGASTENNIENNTTTVDVTNEQDFVKDSIKNNREEVEDLCCAINSNNNSVTGCAAAADGNTNDQILNESDTKLDSNKLGSAANASSTAGVVIKNNSSRDSQLLLREVIHEDCSNKSPQGRSESVDKVISNQDKDYNINQEQRNNCVNPCPSASEMPELLGGNLPGNSLTALACAATAELSKLEKSMCVSGGAGEGGASSPPPLGAGGVVAAADRCCRFCGMDFGTNVELHQHER